jgi:hypothetical protein
MDCCCRKHWQLAGSTPQQQRSRAKRSSAKKKKKKYLNHFDIFHTPWNNYMREMNEGPTVAVRLY